MKSISNLSVDERRLAAADMPGSDVHLLFDGHRACVNFVATAFHFSGALLFEIKK